MKFYDLQKTLSYNCQINAIFGHRSIGKTYTLLKHCVRRFLKHGEKMVYVRRYDNDLKMVKAYIFDDIASDPALKDYEFKCVGYDYYIKRIDSDEWLLFCTLVALSKFQKYKSRPFPDYKYIIVEEYLIENPRLTRYLNNEIDALISVYITVARYNNDVKMFLLSNVGDIVNPLFRWLDINDEPKKGYSKHKLGTLDDGTDVNVLIHYVFDEIISRQTANTVGSVLASTSSYANVAITNQFSGANDYYIAKKTARAKCEYALKFRNTTFTLWCDYKTFIYYINRQVVDGCYTYSLTTEDFRPNMAAIDLSKNRLKTLHRLYSNGCIYFDSPATREQFLNMLKLCGIR